MSQENIIDFYKTKDIVKIVKNKSLPTSGSFIHDTSTDGFYVVDDNTVHSLNANIPIVKLSLNSNTQCRGECYGLKIQVGTIIVLIYNGDSDEDPNEIAPISIYLNEALYYGGTLGTLRKGTPYLVCVHEVDEHYKVNCLFKVIPDNFLVNTTNGGTGRSYNSFNALAAAIQAEAGVTVIDAEVDVPKDGWSGDSSGVYTNTISNITDLLATDCPIIDVLLDSDSAEDNRAALASYQCVSKIEVTAKGTLTLTALDTQPSSAFKLKIKIIRNN